MCGFCDDWAAAVQSIRAIRVIHSLVQEFEKASGLVVHKTKLKFIPSRILTQGECLEMDQVWLGASIARNVKFPGAQLGHDSTVHDLASKARNLFDRRLTSLRTARISSTMRVVSVNVFLFSLFSYISRHFLLPHSVTQASMNASLRLITPCSLLHCPGTDTLQCHLRHSHFLTRSSS